MADERRLLMLLRLLLRKLLGLLLLLGGKGELQGRAFVDPLVEEILGEARVDQDLEILPRLGKDILSVVVIVHLGRRRARVLRRHDRMLLLLMLELVLLLMRTLTLIHDPLSPHLRVKKATDEDKSERMNERQERAWVCGVCSWLLLFVVYVRTGLRPSKSDDFFQASVVWTSRRRRRMAGNTHTRMCVMTGRRL